MVMTPPLKLVLGFYTGAKQLQKRETANEQSNSQLHLKQQQPEGVFTPLTSAGSNLLTAALLETKASFTLLIFRVSHCRCAGTYRHLDTSRHLPLCEAEREHQC